MVRIELVERDAVALRELLASTLSDLKTERVRTDHRGYHDTLREREKLVAELIAQLGGNLSG